MPSTVIHSGPPTHPALHVRDARDALIILEAVRLNMLPLIRRRLTTSEREKLVPGNVFVWEEGENDGSLLRWTDGRRWSQSRMRGDFLFYEEKMELTQQEKNAKAALRVLRATDPLAAASPTNRRKDRPNRPNGLTKQTYSVLVHLPGSSHPRKWHVVAYFTGDDYLRLPVVESYDYLRNLHVPEGIFASSKINEARGDRYSRGESRENYDLADQPDLAYHSKHPMSHGVPSRPTSVFPFSSNALSSTTQQYPLPPSQPEIFASYSHDTPLPGIAVLTSQDAHPGLPTNLRPAYPIHLNRPSPSNYSPLSAEDRRALSSFRVVL